jgi:predicted nucleic acid-binding protein
LVVLDTDILVALLKGNSEAIDEVRRLEKNGDPLSTTLITAYELMKGAYISSKPDENLSPRFDFDSPRPRTFFGCL